MFYGVISDIHSNLVALTAVLSCLEKMGVDSILCLGDIVGYAAMPAECIALSRERSDMIVGGNHDSGTVGNTSIDDFNELAREAILWTRDVLNKKEHEFLNGLPLAHTTDDFLLVHSSPVSPSEWYYIFSGTHARQAFESCTDELIFVGHTHRPALFSANTKGYEIPLPKKAKLKNGERYLVNVGSVGQPRDGNPQASFVTYRSDKRTLQFHRTSYDVKKTQDEITKAGLPDKLAWRLSVGY